MGVIATAKSYIGKVKYVFGANDIDGGKGDCSAFTQHVFKKNGINIGRNTASQYSEGVSVSKGDLTGGELVFFKDTYDSNYIDGVSHVGISLGGTKFIHLSSSGVNISDFKVGYWNEHYLGAKRIDGASDSDTSEEVQNDNSEGSENGVKWFGDIVVIVLCTLLIVGGVSMLALGVKNTVLGG